MMNLAFAATAFIERFIVFSILNPGFLIQGGMENGEWNTLLGLIALALVAAVLGVCGLLAREGGQQTQHLRIQSTDQMGSRNGSESGTARVDGASAGRRHQFNKLVKGT